MDTGNFQNEGRLERLAQAAGYEAGKLAIMSSLSPRQFRRIFHNRFGCSPREWLNQLKLISAQRRLLAGEPVKRIAFELGYHHPSAFCYWFKCASGLWPSDYVNSSTGTAGGLAGATPAFQGLIAG